LAKLCFDVPHSQLIRPQLTHGSSSVLYTCIIISIPDVCLHIRFLSSPKLSWLLWLPIRRVCRYLQGVHANFNLHQPLILRSSSLRTGTRSLASSTKSIYVCMSYSPLLFQQCGCLWRSRTTQSCHRFLFCYSVIPH